LMVADTSESSNTDESGDGLESRAEKIISIKVSNNVVIQLKTKRFQTFIALI
uniref:Rad21_Rec8 domain-containing protein n=1 Tax=Anisakis simplex TaxID=6269 RepID=A0A0M3KK03_ANISI